MMVTYHIQKTYTFAYGECGDVPCPVRLAGGGGDGGVGEAVAGVAGDAHRGGRL